MPTYDYMCTLCGHKMEAFHSMTAEPLTQCPSCNEAGLKRQIGTGAGLIFKGSGFYTTDYRSESYKTGAKADSGSSSSPSTEKPSTSTKTPVTPPKPTATS